ncbi:MAG: hypothetical protein JRJ39_07210 [Deltaproteobacteria bacterium]|nr:hypothetical protein [Deltaproteobacteria bacterium]
MPVDVSIDKKSDLVLRVVQGLVSTDELLKSLEDVLNHPDYHPGMKSLTDLREATPFTNTGDVEQIANLLQKRKDRFKEGKAAVVVSKEVSYGMIRMLQAYAADSPFEIEVFYDIEEAKKWLGVN